MFSFHKFQYFDSVHVSSVILTFNFLPVFPMKFIHTTMHAIVAFLSFLVFFYFFRKLPRMLLHLKVVYIYFSLFDVIFFSSIFPYFWSFAFQTVLTAVVVFSFQYT